ncbi:pantothenate kinase [Devosia enhydra]|uniref:Pantothenate kinase n=1 Tax=Devosia enhydra TaxID=665118 RepID=A0A1K2HYI1_9HYPH|nr:type I pantothenate kinase [Devosia enhydra]SFZ85035.1 pantothenate kinase [Devosia enhydra]
MSRGSTLVSPYVRFSKAEWSRLRADEPMTLDAGDIERLRGLGDPISRQEAEEVYLPLSRLISLYHEAMQGLHRASQAFLGTNGGKVPYIIGVAGSVAVGKSTTARILQAMLSRWPASPKVDLVTTDGFLFPNAVLEARGLMARKGFPESYDRGRFLGFLSDIKSGRPKVTVPVYSHLAYDVVAGQSILIDRPDILIVEGLNILQPGEAPKSGNPVLFASDFLDFSIYLDAEERDLRRWFLERFFRLRETAFQDPRSFFHRYARMEEDEARAFALSAWEGINKPNLVDNILPTRSRADLILKKGPDHAIAEVALRKL